MPTIKTGYNTCPCCNSVVDSAATVNDNADIPKPKDLTICVYCAAVLQFTDDMDLMLFPKVLFDSLDEEEQDELISLMLMISLKITPKSKELADLREKNIKHLIDVDDES